MPKTTTIHIFPEAVAKPAMGAPCNGCGVCCLLEPCPLGMVLSGHRLGACNALRWQVDARQYRCGAITAPLDVLRNLLPRYLFFAVPLLAWLLGHGASRWVAAGVGCDCDAQAVPASNSHDTPGQPD